MSDIVIRLSIVDWHSHAFRPEQAELNPAEALCGLVALASDLDDDTSAVPTCDRCAEEHRALVRKLVEHGTAVADRLEDSGIAKWDA